MTNPALRIAPALPVYLEDFPLPDQSPYSIAVDMGIVRSPMSGGNVRQRRLYANMPQAFALAFHMHTAELALWQDWVNETAYDWFYLPLSSMYSAGRDDFSPPGLVSYHVARFISDLAIAMD